MKLEKTSNPKGKCFNFQRKMLTKLAYPSQYLVNDSLTRSRHRHEIEEDQIKQSVKTRHTSGRNQEIFQNYAKNAEKEN